MKTLCFLIFICFLQVVLSQVHHVGKCPDVHPAEGVDNSKLLGFWFKYANSYFAPTAPLDCVYNTLEVLSGANVLVTDGGRDLASQKAVTLEPYPSEILGNGLLNITVRGVPSVFTVVGTNYQYVSFYSCRNIDDFSYEDSKFILIRESTIDDASVEAALQDFANQGLTTDDIHVVNQAGCPTPLLPPYTEKSTKTLKQCKSKN